MHSTLQPYYTLDMYLKLSVVHAFVSVYVINGMPSRFVCNLRQPASQKQPSSGSSSSISATGAHFVAAREEV